MGAASSSCCFEGLFGGRSRSVPPALREAALSSFAAAFSGAKPTALGVAPGRAEVLGNHTDYNEGFILACAIDKYVVAAGATREGRTCRIASDAFRNAVVEFSLDSLERQSGESAWANYVIGVVSALKRKGRDVGGFDAFFTSNVPPGAGVSSSAAVEMASVKLLAELFPDTVGRMDMLAMVKVAKAAENNFVGMGCGILDQFSSGMGRRGSLIFLDCRTLQYKHVPFRRAVFVLANTHAEHQLVDGKYNDLRNHCFEAAKLIRQVSGDINITHLRDVSSDTWDENSRKLSDDQRRTSYHVVWENKRVQTAVDALKKGNMSLLGELMTGSHFSSRDNFRNSCKELDIMQDLSTKVPGFLGSRLMGGGFGGSTINLVAPDKGEQFAQELSRRYKEKTGIEPTMLICSPGDGAFSLALP